MNILSIFARNRQNNLFNLVHILSFKKININHGETYYPISFNMYLFGDQLY